MPITRDGQFTFNIPTGDLARGLRPSKRVPRDSKFLVECIGAVGLDNVLQVLSDLNLDLIDPAVLVGIAFPYPQLFVFTNFIIVCSDATIFELVGNTLVARLTVVPGQLWSAVEFQDFIFMSNGVVDVQRSATSGVWSLVTDQPIATAMCNFNGQVVIGTN